MFRYGWRRAPLGALSASVRARAPPTLGPGSRGGAHDRELAEVLADSQPKVSRHLKPLRSEGLVTVRRQGTRTLVRFADAARTDPVVCDALAAGEALCRADGSLARVAAVVDARDTAVREFFDTPTVASSSGGLAPEMIAYVAMLGLLVAPRRLAVDVGTGDGGLLDVLAPVFDRVVAFDRSERRLERAQDRVVSRGYENVTLRRSDYDHPAIREEIQGLGGADAVFASRVLHHAPKPAAALAALAALARPGGAVIVLDYEPHEDERLRDTQADVWLGFDPQELCRLSRQAGLEDASVAPIPRPWCCDGPDGHLRWQLLTARCPDSSP